MITTTIIAWLSAGTKKTEKQKKCAQIVHRNLRKWNELLFAKCSVVSFIC